MRVMCVCRQCGKVYDEAKSRADLKGYCSQKCMFEKAKKHGWKKKDNDKRGRSYVDVLTSKKDVGSVLHKPEGKQNPDPIQKVKVAKIPTSPTLPTSQTTTQPPIPSSSDSEPNLLTGFLDTEPATIDVPRLETEGTITIKEPVDRPVHWTDGWLAEQAEKEVATVAPTSATTTQPMSLLGQKMAAVAEQRKVEQQNIPPHMMITARAGTGKTTTLVGGIKRLKMLDPGIKPSNEQQSIWDVVLQSRYHKFTCFAAFGREIAATLRERVPEGVDAKTLHSIGFRAVAKAFNLPKDAVERGEERIPNIIQELTGKDIRELRRETPTIIGAVENLVEKCQLNLVDPDQHHGEDWTQVMLEMCQRYDIDTGEDRLEQQIFGLVPQVMNRMLDVSKDGCITHADMIWLPVVLNLPLFKFDILFVDEAQDMNACQHALIKRLGRRLILCGDPAQAIFGFAGADSDSMPTILRYLQEQPQGVAERKLTVTRRCGKAIVREANQEVPDFFAHPSNPEGIVKTMNYPLQPGPRGANGERTTKEIPIEDTYLPDVQVGDMVLCRSVAPLVSQYFKLMKMGKPATIQGRDIAQQIINLITKMKVNTVQELVGRLDDWLHEELTKEQAKRNPRESFMQMLKDRYDCAMFFSEGLQTVRQVIDRIQQVFVKDEEGKDIKKVRLMSIHKSKGLEANRVFYLRPAVYPGRSEAKMSAWQRIEERNLRYVAKTRAINELIYVV
jgi:superfamily I DNA/RNA helicase